MPAQVSVEAVRAQDANSTACVLLEISNDAKIGIFVAPSMPIHSRNSGLIPTTFLSRYQPVTGNSTSKPTNRYGVSVHIIRIQPKMVTVTSCFGLCHDNNKLHNMVIERIVNKTLSLAITMPNKDEQMKAIVAPCSCGSLKLGVRVFKIELLLWTSVSVAIYRHPILWSIVIGA